MVPARSFGDSTRSGHVECQLFLLHENNQTNRVSSFDQMQRHTIGHRHGAFATTGTSSCTDNINDNRDSSGNKRCNSANCQAATAVFDRQWHTLPALLQLSSQKQRMFNTKCFYYSCAPVHTIASATSARSSGVEAAPSNRVNHRRITFNLGAEPAHRFPRSGRVNNIS